MEVDRIINTIISLKQYKIILLTNNKRSREQNEEQFKIVVNSINSEYYQLIKDYMQEQKISFSKINISDFRNWLQIKI